MISRLRLPAPLCSLARFLPSGERTLVSRRSRHWFAWVLLGALATPALRAVGERPATVDNVRPRIIAHRGASSERPENTLPAIERAIEVGADAIEVDVRTSRDGVLFLLHDATLDRTTDGTGPAARLTMDQLRQLDAGSHFDARYRNTRIATLIEALEACRGRVDLLLDLKESGESYARKVTEAVRTHGDPRRVILGVHSVEQARRFRRLLPQSRQLAFLPSPDAIEAFASAGTETIRQWPRWLPGTDSHGETAVQRVRAAGRRLQLNASNGTPQDLLPLLKYDPDDLLVDDPRRARATLEIWRAHRGAWQWLCERVDVREGTTMVPWVAQVGAPTFLNRNYTMLELPDGIQGRCRWMFAGGEGDRVTLRFRKATVVFAVFEYNQTGLWSFPLRRPPQTFGWRRVPGRKYRGTSNGMLGGRTHYGQVYVRHFAPGEELGEMPKWWICLAVVEPADALRVPGYREAIEGEPPAPSFSYYDWATRSRPLQVPPFESRRQWTRWQEETRAAFRKKLLFPYKGVPRVVSLSEPREREGYAEQAFAFELEGKRLFRFFRLVPRMASRTAEARRLPTIVCFMGHGKVRQILEQEDSYQHACAARFAREGYLVYAMENVGMEPDSDRHLELDRILRLDGYGWYSLLFAHQRMLLDHVWDDPEVDGDHVGVTGVSTGGLLALTAIAMEPRVKAASVQGIFGSMRYSFIRDRHRHCSCGAIPGLLPRFDLPELALLAAPRPLHISNAERDGFPPTEARRCVEQIRPIYEKVGGKVLRFTAPPGRHEYAWKEALAFFQEVMRKPGASPTP